MKTKRDYLLFVAVILFLQIFLFNNITLSVYLSPLIYVACVVYAPLDTSSLKLLSFTALLALLMDVTMGTCGLNVIAAMPLAFFRGAILNFAGYKILAKDESLPSPKKMGGKFYRYLVMMVILHSLLFFGFECFSQMSIGVFLIRFTEGTLCSFAICFAVARWFLNN